MICAYGIAEPRTNDAPIGVCQYVPRIRGRMRINQIVERDKRIFKALNDAKRRPMRRDELREITGMKTVHLQDRLRSLVARGRLIRIKNGNAHFYIHGERVTKARNRG